MYNTPIERVSGGEMYCNKDFICYWKWKENNLNQKEEK